jgi:hypothetical protein
MRLNLPFSIQPDRPFLRNITISSQAPFPQRHSGSALRAECPRKANATKSRGTEAESCFKRVPKSANCLRLKGPAL